MAPGEQRQPEMMPIDTRTEQQEIKHQQKQQQVTVPDNKEQKENEALSKLGRSLRWGLTLATGNMIYGYLLVGSQLSPDTRQDDWWLMSSPLPTYLASVTYVLCVTWLGPRLMKNREPFKNLRGVMVLYNAIQVVYSAYLVWETGMGGWFGSYSFVCQPCNFSNDPMSVRMLHASFWYYFSKFVDFLDTVFFVLHKKYDHVSVLHVSHHALMPINMWHGVRFQPGGHNSLMGFLNSIVHTFMYLYYFLAAMGPSVRPFLWWKKYLTSMQMIQFMIVILHSLQLYFVDCPGVPPQLTQWVAGTAIMFLFLFANFYASSYKKKPKQQDKSRANDVSSSEATTQISNGYSNGVSKGVPKGIPNGVSRRRGLPNSVAETAHKTIELCEKMAFRSQRGAI